MTATMPIPVTATHDIEQRSLPPIKAGTPGESRTWAEPRPSPTPS